MLRIFKGAKYFKSTLALSALVTLIAGSALSYQNLREIDSTSACVCQNDASYNAALPASHPNNRCAVKDDLSWKSWLAGNNSASQFHFVDLLELLYGHTEQPIDDINPTNSHLNN